MLDRRTGSLGWAFMSTTTPSNIKHAHLDLFRRTRQLGCLLCLRRPSAECILEIIIHRVVRLALALRQRKHIEVKALALRMRVSVRMVRLNAERTSRLTADTEHLRTPALKSSPSHCWTVLSDLKLLRSSRFRPS